jgi:hypothetical protein
VLPAKEAVKALSLKQILLMIAINMSYIKNNTIMEDQKLSETFFLESTEQYDNNI